MTMAVTAALGFAAGLHGALYGAYKDSPHESFLLRRFIREIVIALTVSLALAMFYPAARSQSAFVLYLSVFALTRIVTEFWKLFVRVEPQEESFGIMFDERYEGKIAWVDTLNMLTVGGLYLGVGDPYQMTDDELVQVRDFLISKKPLVRFLWNQSYDFWLAFKKEEVWIGYSWPDTVGYAEAAGMNYRYMEPKEGRISWVCGFGLFADSENYYHAHEYVNSWASTEAAEFLMAYYYYGHTNTEVDLSALPTGVVDALGLDDPSVLEPPRAVPESWIPRRDVYAQYWAEVLAA